MKIKVFPIIISIACIVLAFIIGENHAMRTMDNTEVCFNSYLNGWKDAAYQLEEDTALIQYMFVTDSLEMATKMKIWKQ